MSSNTPEMGMSIPNVSSLTQTLSEAGLWAPLWWIPQNRGNVGQNTIAITAYSNTASPEGRRRKEQHISLKSPGEFGNQICYPILESGQLPGQSLYSLPRIPRVLQTWGRVIFLHSPAGCCTRELVWLCGKSSKLGGQKRHCGCTSAKISSDLGPIT